MADGLDWVFKLFDQLSGPAKAMSSSLKALTSSLNQMKSHLGSAGGSLRSLKEDIRGVISTGAGLGGWVSALGAVKGILEVPFGFAKMAIDSLAFKESTLKSFEMILGTKKAAQEMFSKAFDFARITPFETQDVVAAFQQLLSAGFTQKEVPIIYQAVGDVGAMAGFNPEVVRELIGHITRIQALGVADMRDIQAIAVQTGKAGVSQEAIFEQIAKHMHIAKGDVAEMMSHKNISANVGIVSLLEAIQKITSGGTVGKGMLAQAFTIRGLFSTLSSAYGDFWMAMDNASLPGLNTFKEMLQNLSNALDPKSRTGIAIMKELAIVFNETMGALFTKFSGTDGPANVEKAILKVINAFKMFYEIGKGIVGFVSSFFTSLTAALGLSFDDAIVGEELSKKIGALLEDLGGKLGTAVGVVINWFIEAVGGATDKLLTRGQDMGFAFGQGLRHGITEGIGTDLFYALTGADKDSSAATAWEYWVNKNGRAKGTSPTPNLALPGSLPSWGDPSMVGPVQQLAGITVNIDNTGHQDGSAIGAKLQSDLPGMLHQVFAQKAVEKGVHK